MIALVGLLLEEKVVVRIVLLLEVAFASIVGCMVAVYDHVGSLIAIFSLVILLIAAVESILLFGFIILLYKLNQTLDLSKLSFLQF
jgi:NADH:ubiquinone oxidoreductase subunit K